jgi:predicted P-loop ATPase
MKKNGAEVRLADIRNVLQSEYVPLFHPFEAYFGSLPDWDGVDYIGQLARTVHVKGDTERFVEHFRKWFVGMVATIFDEQVVNHEIMVFIGKQGNFKSTFFSLLLPPPLRSYFQVKMNSSHLNKDDMLTLCEKALVCLEEIDELRPSELNQLKALVTAKNISERAAYARNKEHRPHIASFCGTGNNPHFLSDPTDNRRWIVVEVEDIVNPWLHPFNYTGIYSQALALWKSGFRYWFNQDEIRLLNEQNREYEIPNLEEELILTYYRKPFPGSKNIFLKVAEILERVNANIRQPLSSNRLGIMMSKLGFPLIRLKGIRGYLVIERTQEEIQASRKLDGMNPPNEVDS